MSETPRLLLLDVSTIMDSWTNALIESAHSNRTSLRDRLIALAPEFGGFDTQLIDRILQSLVGALGDNDPWVRQAAAMALGQFKEQAQVEPLVRAIDDMYYDAHSETFPVREAAAKALSNLGSRVPIESLVHILAYPGPPNRRGENEVWKAVLQAFTRLRDVAVEPLVRTLGDNDERLRIAAAQALGQLGERAPVEPLVRALGDSRQLVREAAAQALRRRPPDHLEPVILEGCTILKGNGAGKVIGSIAQSALAELLGEIGSSHPAIIGALSMLLEWPFWEVRMKAAQGLSKIRKNIPETTITRLIDLRQDPESQAVCDAADDALAEILTLDENIIEDT